MRNTFINAQQSGMLQRQQQQTPQASKRLSLVKWVDESHRKAPLARDGSLNIHSEANRLRPLNHRKVTQQELKSSMKNSQAKPQLTLQKRTDKSISIKASNSTRSSIQH